MTQWSTLGSQNLLNSCIFAGFISKQQFMRDDPSQKSKKSPTQLPLNGGLV